MAKDKNSNKGGGNQNNNQDMDNQRTMSKGAPRKGGSSPK